MSTRRKKELFFRMLFAVILIIIVMIFFDAIETKAGTIGLDESVGGFSYMMDIIEGKKNLEPDDPYNEIMEKILAYDAPPVWEVTDKARDILYRITEAEATGGNIEQKKNVASCVLARVKAPQWPNTIEGVVFQKQQFTPIWDGRYYTVTITQSTREAVDWVLKNGETHDCLWFCSDASYRKENSYHRKNHTWVFFDGEHHYFHD
ncbi:MAG: cell wall hydrolase [Pseudobutyrivibrio sp.]|nr:cell wall hydrolase [Pseudobutyrivibrio sp.]